MPIPVILVTGYLGAGKTTLVNRLLAMPGITERRVTLVINDYGHPAIDGALVSAKDRSLYTIDRGSIFCTCKQAEFHGVLVDIAQSGETELLLVEASGMAETTDLEALLDTPGLAGHYEVQANLCIVDALNFVPVAAALKAATSQVAAADGVIVNKSDLVESHVIDSLCEVLKQINPDATQRLTKYAQIDTEFLDNLKHTRVVQERSDSAPTVLASSPFEHDGVVDRIEFSKTLEHFGERLLRLKGNIHFNDGLVFCEVVCGRKEEREPEKSLGSKTRFTAIAFGTKRDELRVRFMKCFHTDT